MSALLPVAFDLGRTKVAIVGRDARAARRLQRLDAARGRVRVFSDRPSAALAEAAGARLVRRLPRARDLKDVHLVYIVGLDATETARLAAAARAAKALVNVEDEPARCDVFSVAVVRRGDLVLGISTGGRCPALARRLRTWLERLIPEGFAATVAALGEERSALREAGHAPAAILARADRAVETLDPLSPSPSPPPH